MRSIMFVSVLAFALGGVSLPALAQNVGSAPAPQTAATRQPEPETKSFGDWTMRCFPVQSPAPCDVFQASFWKQTHNRATSTSIAYVPSRDLYAVQFTVPLGVSLAKGMGFSVGSYNVSGVPFRRCTREGCLVESPIDPKAVQAMTTGDKAMITVTAYGGKDIHLPLSLNGFSAALAAMKDAAKAKAVNPPASGAPSGGGK